MGKNLNDPEVRSQVSTALLEKIKQLPDAVEQDFWVKKLASVLDIKYEILYEKMKKIKGLNIPEVIKTTVLTPDKKSKEDQTAEKLLALILHRPDFFKVVIKNLNSRAITSQDLSGLYENLLLFYNNAQTPPKTGEELIHSFKVWNGQEEVCQMIDILGLLYDKEYPNLSQKDAEEEVSSIINYLNLWYNGNIRKKIEGEMREAEKKGDKDKIQFLMQKFKDLL